MVEVNTGVRTILRAEGLLACALSIVAYVLWSEHGWTLFAVAFLAPDLSMLGYLAGPRVGALTYNAAHAYVGPAILGLAALLWLGTFWFAIALIWNAHIGFDRVLGYGLKLPQGFGYTHLGPVGRSRPRTA